MYASRLAGLVAAAGFALVGLAAPVRAAAGQERVDAYGVTLRVARDGGLHVTEKITYDFGTSKGRHGIVRTIPSRGRVDAGRDRVIEVRNARVEGPGHLDVATSDGNTVLKVGNPGVTVSGVRTYVIDYDVPQALVPRSTSDELFWNAVGTEWKVPVRAVTVAVSAPVRIAAAKCLRGAERSTKVCAGGTPSGSAVTFTQPELSPGEGVTVKVEVPKAGMNPIPPRFEARRAPFAPTLPAGVLTLVAFAVAAVAAWRFLPRRVRRTARAASPGVRPGLAGALRRGGVAGSRDVAATIVDLASRGYLRFEETPDRGRTKQRIVRGDRSAADLMPYEAKTVECLIGRERLGYRGGSVTLSSPWTARAAIYDLMEEETIQRGWFRRPLRAQRTRTGRLAALFGAAGAVLFIAATGVDGVPAGLGWPALVFFASAVAVRTVGRRPALTAGGARALAGVNAYAEALRPGDPAAFPYAIAFGETAGWTDALLDADLPWYVAAEDADSARDGEEDQTAGRHRRAPPVGERPPAAQPVRLLLPLVQHGHGVRLGPVLVFERGGVLNGRRWRCGRRWGRRRRRRKLVTGR